MISKKKLLYLIEKNLNEMPIDYGDNPERIHPSIERKISTKQNPYKGNPAIPQEKPEGIASNFEELISSKRFIDIVNKVKYYTDQQGNITSQNTMVQLLMMVERTLLDVLSFESRRKNELENLAVELVKKEMAIPEGSLQFDAKIVGIGQISDEGFSNESQNYSEEEIEQQFGVNSEQATEDLENLTSAMEKFNDEIAKRRFLNALIQGASKKGHYMFNLVIEQLNRMDPTIVKKYGILMSINDIAYWIYPDEVALGLSGGGEAGKEEVDTQTDPPTVRARGTFFPILIHELIKGVMEVMATKGLPNDPRSAEMVMGVADTSPNEIWDLRFGPVIWEKFIESYPEKLFEDDKKYLQNYLFARFSSLNTNEFFKLAKMIMKGDEKGKEILEKMVKDIEDTIKREDYEQEEYLREYGNDGLGGFLDSLGISLSDDEE